MDPYPAGPKICGTGWSGSGFGSGTLVVGVRKWILNLFKASHSTSQFFRMAGQVSELYFFLNTDHRVFFKILFSLKLCGKTWAAVYSMSSITMKPKWTITRESEEHITHREALSPSNTWKKDKKEDYCKFVLLFLSANTVTMAISLLFMLFSVW